MKLRGGSGGRGGMRLRGNNPLINPKTLVLTKLPGDTLPDDSDLYDFDSIPQIDDLQQLAIRRQNRNFWPKFAIYTSCEYLRV